MCVLVSLRVIVFLSLQSGLNLLARPLADHVVHEHAEVAHGRDRHVLLARDLFVCLLCLLRLFSSARATLDARRFGQGFYVIGK